LFANSCIMVVCRFISKSGRTPNFENTCCILN
jgi:hypothetical protein